MAYTMQQVIDRARQALNDDKNGADDSLCRTKDVELLGYANDAVVILRQRRPDIFFGQFEALPGPVAVGVNMPVPDEYFVALADYVTARGETPNDESAVEGRATLFFGLFGEQAGA